LKNRLKVLRAERDWSQGDLADALGYDPSLPLAFRIADLFDMPLETLFSPDPKD
jgi:putative transcriptional regulator